MTQVTPTPVRPAAEADEVGRRAAPPTPSRGGWSIGIFVLMLAIVAAIAIVGVGGSKARINPSGADATATEASVSPDQCTEEFRMVSVAFEAYYAENGHSAESLEVLVGTFLREVPSNWTYSPATPRMITGIAGCADVGTVEMSGDL